MSMEPRPWGSAPPEPSAETPAFRLIVIGLLLGLVVASFVELRRLGDDVPQPAAAAPEPVSAVRRPAHTSSPISEHPRQTTERIPARPVQNGAPVKPPTVYRPRRLDRFSVSPTSTTAQYSSPAPRTAAPPQTRRPGNLHVDRVLVGSELLSAGIVSESLIKAKQDESQYVVCFVVSGAGSLGCADFRLQDREGTSYEPLCELSGSKANRGASRQLVFAIYNDSAPEQLLYRSSDGRFAPLSLNAGR